MALIFKKRHATLLPPKSMGPIGGHFTLGEEIIVVVTYDIHCRLFLKLMAG